MSSLQIALGVAVLWPEDLLAVRQHPGQVVGLEHGSAEF
jgi:hypothetical protein